jgi:hypothetical protein
VKTQVVIDTMKLAYLYLGKAVADGELANCAMPVENALKQVGMVLAELENENCTGVELIAQERERQIEKEGWTAEHDADHTEGQLAKAAACYAFDAVALPTIDAKRFIFDNWPWSRKWWKPTPDDTIRQLTKAGALIAAEIDRLQRTKQ